MVFATVRVCDFSQFVDETEAIYVTPITDISQQEVDTLQQNSERKKTSLKNPTTDLSDRVGKQQVFYLKRKKDKNKQQSSNQASYNKNQAATKTVNSQRRFTHLHYNQYNPQILGANNGYSYSTIRRPVQSNNYNINYNRQPTPTRMNYQGFYANTVGSPYRAQYSFNRRVASSTTRKPIKTTTKKFRAPMIMF